MGRAVVVGGSIGGLMSALALSRAGWDVDVVERDPLPDVDDVEAAFGCHPRPAVPQAGHSHNLFAAVSATLRERAPEALDAMSEAGVRRLRIRDAPPPPLAGVLAGAGDEDLVGLAARRSTFEWALRRYVSGLPGVRLRHAHVVGLAGDSAAVPVVRGVRLDDDSVVDADFVVDAGGRRSQSNEWIAALGGREVGWERHEVGTVYYTRYYRRHADVDWLPLNRGVASGVTLPTMAGLALPADHDTFSITVMVPSHVAALKVLRDADVFQSLLAATPVLGAWGADPAYAEPTTDVRVMGGFSNGARRDAAFSPYAHNFALLGDAFMHTNPMFARGISVATGSAFALADLLSSYDDPGDRDAAWRRYLAEHVLSRFDDVVARDAERLAVWSAVWAGEVPVEVPFAGDLTWTEVMRAAAVDEVVWRATTRYLNVLERFDDAITPELLERVRALRDAGRLPMPLQGPSTGDILDAVGASLVS